MLQISVDSTTYTFDTKLMVQLDENTFSADEASLFTKLKDYGIRKLGDTLLFVFDEVTVVWNCNGEVNVKVGFRNMLS